MVEKMDQSALNINHGNSVKKCKISSSIQTTNKTSEHKCDLISALPDSLLLHVLSFLDMEDVVKTSLLSRRWRYLWKSISCLCFNVFTNFTFIDRCLFHYEGSKIRKFHTNFDYEDTDALLVDSWIYFAIRRKVQDLELVFTGPTDNLYKVPRSLYSCGTLISLSLSWCDLNLPDSFQLGSLRKLSLEYLDLNSDSIERLTSSCPLLEDLHLINCNEGSDLNIIIKNEHVKILEINRGIQFESGTVKINAPSLLSLVFSQCLRERYQFEELGSLISADIDCQDVNKGCCDDQFDELGRNLVGILHNLRHVQHLKLRGCCLQVLSSREVRRLVTLSIRATCLELQTEFTKWELPGISYLMKSCSNLENLKINVKSIDQIKFSYKFYDEYDFEEEEYWKSLKIGLPSVLQKVKIIKINGFSYSSITEEFVRFLLNNSKVLERMVINTPKEYHNNFELLFTLTQRLIVFPRSSPNAELLIT